MRHDIHYADWKPLISASQLESITWIFSPGHAGVLGEERTDVLAKEAVIKGDFIMDPPAVRGAVQKMLSATRVEEDFNTLNRLRVKNVARGDSHQGMLHGPAKRRANQLLMETTSIYTLRWALRWRLTDLELMCFLRRQCTHTHTHLPRLTLVFAAG